MHTTLPPASADPWRAAAALPGLAAPALLEAGPSVERGDLGTRLSATESELVTLCPPAEALQAQFEKLDTAFIAVHDLGTTSSARLLDELGGGLKCPVQTLHIRRHGISVPLASLRFIDLPSARGAPLRVFSTTVEGDIGTRRELAELLMAFSRLGVLLVGPLPPHALASTFAPWRDRLLTVPWANRHLLLVPVGTSAPELADHARKLVSGTMVAAAVTPLAGDTASRWNYIHGTWNRLRRPDQRAPAMALPPTMGNDLPTEPLPMRPMPSLGPPAALTPAQLSRYAQAASMLKGALGCCVFELDGARAVAHAGRHGAIDALATQGSGLLAAARDSGEHLGADDAGAECLVTLERQLLFVRRLPQQPALGMLAVFDRAAANPTLLRVQLQRLEPLLDLV